MHGIAGRGMTRRAGLVGGAVLLLLGAAARADVLDVPGEHRTIQAAITAASGGDTVRVAPGTYAETIDFLGKDVTVESSAGAAVTTIDGGGTGPVVLISGGASAAVLRGFTVTGGVSPDYGGGVRVQTATATIEDCEIVGNSAAFLGGGVVAGPFAGASLTMSGCTLRGNATTTFQFATFNGGGGLAALSGSTVLTGCRIEDNSAFEFGGLGGGGGFRTGQRSSGISGGGSLVMTGCTVTGNTTAGHGGGGLFRYSIQMQGSAESLTMTDCRVEGNEAGGWGGGVAFIASTDALLGAATGLLERCVFLGNEAVFGGGLVAIDTGSPLGVTARDCLFAGNTATSEGGGAWFGAWATARHCTVTGNAAPAGAGLVVSSSSPTPVPSHLVVWDNAGPEIGGTTGVVHWSDVQGGYAGTGNLDADPLFLDAPHGDWRIAPLSPCRDAGDPAFLPAVGETDLGGEARVIDGRVDMGADEAGYSIAPWTDLAHGLAGGFGEPVLAGAGALLGGDTATLTLTGGAPGAFAWLFIGLGKLDFPNFYGGYLYPTLDFLIGPFTVSGSGDLVLAGTWPTGIPGDTSFFFQHWLIDATGPYGLVGSNALMATAP